MPYKKNGQDGNRPPRQNQNAGRSNRPDNRSGNRSGNRQDNRPDNRPDNRSRSGDDRPARTDSRSDYRPAGNPSRRIPEDRGYSPRTGQEGVQGRYQGRPYEGDSRPGNRTGNRTGNRMEKPADNRPDNRSDNRPDNRNQGKPFDKSGGRFEKGRGYQERPNSENNRGSRQNKPAPVAPKPPEAPVQPVAPEELPYFLMGRNAVREAVKSGRSIDRILVTPEIDGSLREILGLAKDRGLLIRETPKAKLDELCMPFGHNGKPGNHQGILAMVPPVEYATLEDMLALAKERGEPPFILLLEELTDPYNLGSILRSALCAGAHGVVITKRRAASITAAVAKASAGAVEYIKVAKVNNISAALQQLKKAGLWIAGGDMGGKPMAMVDLKGPLAIVMGNEGEGLSRLVKENCDHLVRVPIQGPVESLNVSVAAAVLLFEKVRQESIK